MIFCGQPYRDTVIPTNNKLTPLINAEWFRMRSNFRNELFISLLPTCSTRPYDDYGYRVDLFCFLYSDRIFQKITFSEGLQLRRSSIH